MVGRDALEVGVLAVLYQGPSEWLAGARHRSSPGNRWPCRRLSIASKTSCPGFLPSCPGFLSATARSPEQHRRWLDSQEHEKLTPPLSPPDSAFLVRSMAYRFNGFLGWSTFCPEVFKPDVATNSLMRVECRRPQERLWATCSIFDEI